MAKRYLESYNQALEDVSELVDSGEQEDVEIAEPKQEDQEAVTDGEAARINVPEVDLGSTIAFDPRMMQALVGEIKNHCVEVPDMDYDDGATTLLLYVDGDPEGYPKELVQLLAYMKNSIPENVCNPDLAQIHSCVDKVKKDPKVREVFVTLEEYVEREKAEALEEAERRVAEEKKRADEAEKKAIEEKSRADKADRQIVASIRMIMSLSEKSADSAMDELGIDVEMRDYYKAML